MAFFKLVVLARIHSVSKKQYESRSDLQRMPECMYNRFLLTVVLALFCSSAHRDYMSASGPRWLLLRLFYWQIACEYGTDCFRYSKNHFELIAMSRQSQFILNHANNLRAKRFTLFFVMWFKHRSSSVNKSSNHQRLTTDFEGFVRCCWNVICLLISHICLWAVDWVSFCPSWNLGSFLLCCQRSWRFPEFELGLTPQFIYFSLYIL